MSNQYPLVEGGGVVKNPIFTGHPDNKKPELG